MANPNLTIQPDKARLTVTGKSWDDITTDSGPGDTIEQITIDDIEDLIDIDLPDIPEDVPIIIGDLPGWDDPVIIIDWPDGPEIIELPDLDLDDLDLDWEIDLSFSDLDDLYLVDVDLNIEILDLPDEIRIAHVPVKTTYTVGQHIDLDGLMVRAYKNGEIWEGPDRKYYNGYIPAHELDYAPKVAGMNDLQDFIIKTDRCSQFCQNRHFTATAGDGAVIYINENDELRMYVTFLSEHSGPCGTFNGSTAQANTLVYADGISTLYKSSEYRYTHNCDEQISPYYTEYIPLDAEAIKDMLGGVTVAWNRYGDGKTLRATFDITVKAKGNGGR